MKAKPNRYIGILKKKQGGMRGGDNKYLLQPLTTSMQTKLLF